MFHPKPLESVLSCEYIVFVLYIAENISIFDYV